mmetsp:Transcript_41145/g.63397  ORF Transcript_41145/g.63397 Transcript_41145/m.63397 type:complete len:98 (-) Transcript_41145:14-307(-)
MVTQSFQSVRAVLLILSVVFMTNTMRGLLTFDPGMELQMKGSLVVDCWSCFHFVCHAFVVAAFARISPLSTMVSAARPSIVAGSSACPSSLATGISV